MLNIHHSGLNGTFDLFKESHDVGWGGRGKSQVTTGWGPGAGAGAGAGAGSEQVRSRYGAGSTSRHVTSLSRQ